MKKILLKSLVLVIGVVVICQATVNPAFAEGTKECGGVATSIIECDKNAENGGINHILDLVVKIMSIGVGILGVVGITIVGIQYLTAGGSEEKTRKAKRRLIEILIGLAVYAVMAALLSWLLPNFDSSSMSNNAGGSNENGGGGSGSGSNPGRKPGKEAQFDN